MGTPTNFDRRFRSKVSVVGVYDRRISFKDAALRGRCVPLTCSRKWRQFKFKRNLFRHADDECSLPLRMAECKFSGTIGRKLAPSLERPSRRFCFNAAGLAN
ncbi:MAG: hypothetical protein ACTS6G_03415 [Candidatus Hodgkinia cicadicola]